MSEEIRTLEEEKREVAVRAERVKIGELEAALARLRDVCTLLCSELTIYC